MEIYTEKQVSIINVAEKLFAEKGFHGTSVRDIALVADVNVAMISYYFGSKEKLLEAIVKQKMQASKDIVQELLDNESLPPIEKIYYLIDVFTDKVFVNQRFHCIMAREQMNQEGDSAVRNMIMVNKREVSALIRELVLEGQRKGAFTKDVDILMIGTTLFGTLNHAISGQDFHRKLAGLEDMPEQEFRVYLSKRLSGHLKKVFKAILTHEF
jgi:AcrR family transcriptional regulator